MVVVGGSKGVGKEICARFKDTEYDVVSISRSAGDIVGDVSDRGFRLKLLRELNPYIVINCAATYPYHENVAESLQTNLVAALDLTLGFYEKMNEGFIINISSVSSLYDILGSTNELVYSVAKRALSDFTTRLQLKNKKGVKICTIEPGMIETDFANIKNRMASKNPEDVIFKLGITPMKPNYVAEVVHWVVNQPKDICISHLRISNTAQNQAQGSH